MRKPIPRFACLTSTCWPHLPVVPCTIPVADVTRSRVRKRCPSSVSAEEVSELRKCANPSLLFAPHQHLLPPSVSSTLHCTVLAGE